MHAERALGVSRSGPGCSGVPEWISERSFYGIYMGLSENRLRPLSWFIMVYHGLSLFSLLKCSIHLGLSATLRRTHARNSHRQVLDQQ